MSVCAACGEPVSYTDEGGCVGTDPAYHFKAECLLEAARRADAQLQGAVEERDRYWQALVDIAGHANWEPKAAGDIARAALAPQTPGGQ